MVVPGGRDARVEELTRKADSKNGPRGGWGYSGYIDLPLKQYSHYIAEYYYVSLDSSATNIRAEA